jgi:uncharacterized membrane protein
MSPTMSEWMNLGFRWLHVIAGVMWIGHLYFFNFVNGKMAAALDGEVKRKVVPQLMPRALYWFRWGAAWTWITGVLLFGVIYSMGGALVDMDSTWSPMGATGLVLGVWILSFLIYDVLWKTPMKNMPLGGTIVSLILLAAVSYGMGSIITGRALFISVGALMGTSMAANVWMRIWPAQKKIIAAVAAGEAPDGQKVAMATLRSKHNTYMSVPLLFLMISNHYPTVYGDAHGWAWVTGITAVGFVLTWMMYAKSGSAATTKY